jgi:hypothetical protein
VVLADDSVVSPFRKQERRIVRLRKCDGAGGSEGEDVLAEREREHVWREAVFCRGVMVPLLGECYIQPPTAARMDRSEVRRLDQMLRTQRPGSPWDAIAVNYTRNAGTYCLHLECIFTAVRTSNLKHPNFSSSSVLRDGLWQVLH